MKKLYKFICSMTLAISMLIGHAQYTYAAEGLSIAGSSSIATGSTATLTIKSMGGFTDNLSVSVSGDGQIISSVSRNTLDSGETATVKVKLTGESMKVVASGTFASYSTEKEYSDSTGMTITAKKTTSDSSSGNSSSSSNGSTSNNSGSTANSSNNQNENQENKTEEKEAKKSSVNTLSSLSVSEGTLSPQFSSSTTNYSVKLSAEQTKISVSAKAKDSKAKVSGTGSHSLKAGENTIKVKCTAEDGSVKTYTITAYVDEKPTVYTEFNDQKLGVVRDLGGVEGPNKSFEETKVTLDGQEVQGWKSEQLGKTVVYLVDENNEEGYYLVEDGKITSQLEPVSFAGINMYIVDIPQDKQNIEGMQFKELTIENQKIPGWVFENEKLSNYELIYVMLENGDYAYYMHEKNDNTFMKYSEEFIEVPEKIENTKEELKDTNTLTMIFIGTTIIFAVSTISLAIIYINFKKKSISAVKEYYDRKYGNDDE